MPEDAKVTGLDQSKRGLQGDHDPREPAQKQNDKKKGVQPPEGDTQGGLGSQGGM